MPGLDRLIAPLFAESQVAGIDAVRLAAPARALAMAAPWSITARDLAEPPAGTHGQEAELEALGLHGGLLISRVVDGEGRYLFLVGRPRAGTSAPDRPQVLALVDGLVAWLGLNSRSRRGQRTHLTPREREILAVAADGLTHEAIAERLAISISGVMSRLRSAQRKLAARNRSQAIARAIWFGEIAVTFDEMLDVA